MFRYFFALILALCTGGFASAGWYEAGGGYFYWLGVDGRADGYLYRAMYDGYGHLYYKNLGPYTQYTQPVISVLPPGSAPVTQQSAGPIPSNAGGYGATQNGQTEYDGEGNWRTKLLQLAAKQQDHRQYLEAISALGLKGVYGVESPASSMTAYSAQFGGSLGAVTDLPLQQGNTVYGSINPTYNTLADPFRNFDVGAAINQLGSLAVQVEVGSSRVRSDLAQTLQQTTESYRLIRETESRLQGTKDILALLAQVLQANESRTFQVTRDQNGKPSIQIVPEAQTPPGPGGPPPGGPGMAPSGAAAPAAAPGPDTQKAFGRLVEIVGNRCLECHGGSKTDPGQKLKLGQGRSVDLSQITDRQAAKIWERVSNGTMPQGGGLPADEKAVIEQFFSGAK